MQTTAIGTGNMAPHRQHKSGGTIAQERRFLSSSPICTTPPVLVSSVRFVCRNGRSNPTDVLLTQGFLHRPPRSESRCFL